MRLQNVAKIVGLCVLAALLATFLYRRGVIPLQAEQGAPVGPVNTTIGAEKQSQTGVRIAEQIEESALESSDLAPGSTDPGAPSVRTDAEVEEFQRFLATASAEGKAMKEKRETDQLVSAGFSPERADWLRTRAAELAAARRQNRSADTDPHTSSIYVTDGDLDLMNEIGEEEYDRFRQALGRPNGVSITEVPASSGLQAHGIQAGDVIVRVDGTRTYNTFMLTKATRDPRVGANVVVEVRRGGQTFPVVVPAGSLVNLRMEMPGAALLRTFRPPPSGTLQ